MMRLSFQNSQGKCHTNITYPRLRLEILGQILPNANIADKLGSCLRNTDSL